VFGEVVKFSWTRVFSLTHLLDLDNLSGESGVLYIERESVFQL